MTRNEERIEELVTDAMVSLARSNPHGPLPEEARRTIGVVLGAILDIRDSLKAIADSETRRLELWEAAQARRDAKEATKGPGKWNPRPADLPETDSYKYYMNGYRAGWEGQDCPSSAESQYIIGWDHGNHDRSQ